MGVLITGGTGFVGAEVARILIEADGEHPVLMDLFPDREAVADLAEAVTIVRGDFAEPAELMAVLSAHNIDAIVHLAYFTAAADLFPSQAARVNGLGTTRLFELAHTTGVRRVVWPSSAAVYGTSVTSATPVWHTEAEAPAPNTVYGASKLFNEHVAEAMATRIGFDHIGLRLCSVFGPRRAGRRDIPPDFYARLLEPSDDAPGLVAPPPDHVLTWAYVKDAARAFHAALHAEQPPRRVYNFSGPTATVREAVDFAKSLDARVDVSYGETGTRHLAYLDAGNLRADLGYEPRYTMQDAMTDYVGARRA
jgi:nucleoside-diphosphate-sugar epimerase